MRVVGGIYRHRELLWPKNLTTRPSKDMVREAIFSALGDKVINSVVLDLFAGSGAFAIEAISRGAKFIYLVDNSLEAIKAINKNLTNLKITDAKTMLMDYQKAIKELIKEKVKIDLLFLDPPYQMNQYQDMINLLKPILSNNVTIVIESDKAVSLNLTFNKAKEYRYGKTLVTILWK